jgi:predicted nucleic acid-binding protein
MQMPDMSKDDWREAARLYAELKTKGRPMEDADLLQAVFCLHHGYTLVTHKHGSFFTCAKACPYRLGKRVKCP